MHIVFLSTGDPFSIHHWSGTTNHILKALQRLHQVTIVGRGLLEQMRSFSEVCFTRPKEVERYCQLIGALCSERIKNISDADLVFFGDLYIDAFLDIDIPVINLSDTTFTQMIEFRQENHRAYVPSMIECERKALNQIYTKILYASEWPRECAVNYYNCDRAKIEIINFGANLPHPVNYQVNIDLSYCHIVFIGRSWKNKGGDIAFETFRILQRKAFPCKMTFIGCIPPIGEPIPDNIEIIPFLDKNKPADLGKLCSILYNAHFLILPTRFEAFGIVFAEASAYGVPSIATRVGGTIGAIKEGKNGFLLPLSAKAEEYANKIIRVFSDQKTYLQLRKNTRREYERRLNWDVWSKKVTKIFEQTVEQYKNEQKS